MNTNLGGTMFTMSQLMHVSDALGVDMTDLLAALHLDDINGALSNFRDRDA